MQIQSMVYYIQSNVICIAVLAYLAIKSRAKFRSMSTEESVFVSLIINTIVYCIADALCWYADGRDFRGARAMVYAANIVYIACVPLMSYMWADYIMCKVSRTRLIKPWYGKILSVAVIVLLLNVSTPLTGFAFSVDEANVYHRGIGAYFSPTLGWIVILCITAFALVKAVKSRRIEDRNNFLLMIQFLIPIFIASIFQASAYGISLSQIGFTVSLTIVYICRQETQISIDELTGLNNRRELNKYFEKMFTEQCDNVCVCIVDADDFKSINDSYGHIEGDNALKMLSQVLKDSLREINENWFVARYGGDEFAIVGIDKTEENVNALRAALHRQQKKVTEEKNRPYVVNFSFGYQIGAVHSKDDVERLIMQADSMMYCEKSDREGKTPSERR